MDRFNYHSQFKIEQFITFNRDGTVLISARSPGNREESYFLVSEQSGTIYARSYHDVSWTEIIGFEREVIFAHLEHFRNEARNAKKGSGRN